MPQKHSLIDRLYYANRRDYTDKQGNVAYLDGAPLRRPLSLKGGKLAFAALIVAIGIIIGALFVNNTVLAQIRETQAAEQALIDNLAREASIETIPIMTELAGMSDEELLKYFEEAGFIMVDIRDIVGTEDMTLFKVPSDMSDEEVLANLKQGVNTLQAQDAVKLLNGSWHFAAEREGVPSIVVRYTDFTTGDPAIAVQHALEKEGFDATEMESGVDDSGNTYDKGVVKIDDDAYTWQISAIPLDEMYSFSKMPEEACYVGVRLTPQ